VSNLGGDGPWNFPANECRSWAYTFSGDVRCGRTINDYGVFDQYQIVLIELTANMIDVCIELKKQTKCFVIGVPESEIVPLWPLATLKKYKEMLDMCDLVGVINEKALEPLRALTSSKVEFVGLPYPLAWAKQQIKDVKKNNLIELGNMNVGVGVPYNILVFNKLDCNGIFYFNPGPERNIIHSLTNNRLKCLQPKGYQDYFREHIFSFCGLHMDIRHTVGRFGLDCAASNTPLVGTHYSQSQGHLFPEISVNHWEIEKAVSLVKRLYFDSAFYDHIVEYANEKIKDFDIDVTRERLLNYLP
jgi:hypothetical protein